MWLVSRLAGVWLLTGNVGYPQVDGDVFEYQRWHQLLFSGHMPWTSFPVEYPPGVFPAMLLPGGRAGYELVFIAVALAVDALVLRALMRRGLRRGRWFWMVMPLAIGPIVWVRFDIFVAALLIAAVILMREERWQLSGVCIAGAALLKLWPVLLIGLAWYYVPRSAFRKMLVAAFIAIVVPVGAVVAAGGFHGLELMLRYQGARGVEVESLWAAPLAVGHALAGWAAPLRSHGTGEYAVQGVYGALATVALPAAVLMLGLTLHRRSRIGQLPALAKAFGCLVAVVLLTAKTLSAQYILWAVAATVLVADAMSRRAWRRCAASGLLYAAATQFVFPWSWWHLIFNDTQAVVATVVHAEMLVLWCAVILGVGLAVGGGGGDRRVPSAAQVAG